ncbi:alpha/beta fold hydrolase [Agromyces sp. H66]|uniref:alpha/beta hydrolase family protein n=1 Tax=Agromyces sp. H66 TaxID=2529859 RepID=UPI0010AB1AA0|nr:alpha/beta fold hydrolase [Agromyces sp. H66]
MKLYFENVEFDQQFQRTAAKAVNGCCDLGEIFAIAARITPGDYDSWYREWWAAAESLRELAEAERAAGHRVNAASAHLRASEYYRAAYFFTRREQQGEALLAAFHHCQAAFRAAAPDLPYPAEPITIPFEGVELSGYVIRAAGATGPTLLMPTGYDSPSEEYYSLGAMEAAARGLTVVVFSGPGQAEMLYDRGIGFRPDFEVVVSAVIDFIETRDDLDAERIGILGRSFGGYLAPRAASAEPRIRALAADPAQFDMLGGFMARMPQQLRSLYEAADPAFDDAIWAAFPGVHGQEFWLSRARAHGLDSPLAYAQEMAKYTVDVERIACPTFVSYGEGDFAQTDTKGFFDRLTVDEKRFTMYREADGGGGHCEGMGPSRFYNDVFGWFADVLA